MCMPGRNLCTTRTLEVFSVVPKQKYNIIKYKNII